jgi:hypothetical protein
MCATKRMVGINEGVSDLDQRAHLNSYVVHNIVVHM